MRFRRRYSRLIICLLIVIALWKAQGIASRVERAKSFIRSEYVIWKRHHPVRDLSSLQPLTSDGTEWFSRYHFIAHSGGGIDGKTHTDSLEAWQLSYERGDRIFDADLNFTSDNHLVLRHSWRDDLEQKIVPPPPHTQFNLPGIQTLPHIPEIYSHGH